MSRNGFIASWQRSVVPRLPAPSPTEWKRAFKEVKALYLRRRYKQCAGLATDLLRQYDGQMYSLYQGYLHYYAAASYEALGDVAHNYSTNKIPLLDMAKECYASCDSSLAAVAAFLSREQDKLNYFSLIGRNQGGVSSEALPHSHPEPTLNARTSCGGQDDKEIGGSLGVENPGENNVFGSPNGTYVYSASCYSPREYDRYEYDDENDDDGEDDGENGFWQMSENAKLMPAPLCIRKSYGELDQYLDSPLSKPRRHGSRPVSEHIAGRSEPFNGQIAPRPGTKIRYGKTTVAPPPMLTLTLTTAEVAMAARNYEAYVRMAGLISSLRSQLAANIEAVTKLINTTAEIQREHRANKDNRLASFWSFTPTFQTPINNKKGDKANSVSGSSTGSSQSSGGRSNRTTSTDHTIIVDDSRQQRIERLRAGGWRNVGIRTPGSGWKGAQYYERLCEKALSELYQ